MSDYPTFSRAERIADGTIHSLGVALAIAGAVFLIQWTGDKSAATQIAIGIYTISLITTFVASACYHMTPWENIRPLLRRLDHAAIYFIIAGTYTPLVVRIGTQTSYSILGIIWALAVIGMVLKLLFWRVPGRLGPVIYLLMGWLSVALIWPMMDLMPVLSLWLIVIGGLLYTSGVLFFSADKLKFSNAIWHGFVLVASACFFAAIALSVISQT